MECPLCTAKSDDRQLVFQKGKAYCIVNHAPLKEGHLMVLPVRHETELGRLEGDELKDIHVLLDDLSKVLKKIYGQDVIIELNRGKHSTQPHIHYHILPAKNGLRHLVSNYEKVPIRQRASWEDLSKVIEKVKEKL